VSGALFSMSNSPQSVESAILQYRKRQKEAKQYIGDAARGIRPSQHRKRSIHDEKIVYVDDDGVEREHPLVYVDRRVRSRRNGRPQRDTSEEEDEEEENSVERPRVGSLKPYEYLVNIPGVSLTDPEPVQLPDGRRYPGDKKRYTPQFFDKEWARKKLVEKHEWYNAMYEMAGYANQPSVVNMYVYTDTGAEERAQRAEEERRRAANELRLRELQKVFAQRRELSEQQQLLDRVVLEIEKITFDLGSYRSQNPELELALEKQWLGTLQTLIGYADEPGSGWVAAWEKIFAEGMRAIEAGTTEAMRRFETNYTKYAHTVFMGSERGMDIPRTLDDLQEAHTLAVTNMLSVLPLGERIENMFKEETGLEMTKTTIGEFNRTMSSMMSGDAILEFAKQRTEIVPKLIEGLEKQTKEKLALEKRLSYLETERGDIERELQLEQMRQSQLRKQIDDLVASLAETPLSTRPNVEWMTQPEHMGRVELKPKVYSSLNKAYSMILPLIHGARPDMQEPTLELLLSDPQVRTPFINLAGNYYYLDGVGAQYVTADEMENKRAETGDIIEFFSNYVLYTPDGRLRRSNTSIASTFNPPENIHPSMLSYSIYADRRSVW
jgi:hypothetical protein